MVECKCAAYIHDKKDKIITERQTGYKLINQVMYLINRPVVLKIAVFKGLMF